MKKNDGFTLFELMIVITMVGILVSIAVPSIASALKRQRFISSSNEIRQALNAAKILAMQRQSDALVQFTQGVGGTAGYSISLNEVIVKKGTLNTGVKLYEANFNGKTSTQFNQMGFAYGFNGDVRICDATNQSFRRIVVSPVGSIKLEKSSKGTEGTWH